MAAPLSGSAYNQANQQRANELPAPRTIAASKADVLSNLAFFFGDPVVPERLRDYSEHHAMTFHFPDACALLPRHSRCHTNAHAGVHPCRAQTMARTQRYVRRSTTCAPPPCPPICLAPLSSLLPCLGSILKSPQEWHTQVALPFVKIVGTTVECTPQKPIFSSLRRAAHTCIFCSQGTRSASTSACSSACR